MHKVYVRELRPYSLAALGNKFDCSIPRAKELVGDLMVRGIVRYRTGRKSDPEEADAEGAAPDELYQFRFVGILMLGDVVIVAYPKYFRDREPTDDELKIIFRALKSDAGFMAVSTLENDGDRRDDRLPVMLALLELYGEYGEYSNYIEGRELNGNGPIDWNRTIGEHLPVISNKRPVYLEYETHRTLRDDSDYITRLHRAVLTECSREFHEAGIDKLLSLDEVWLSDEEVEDFGDAEVLGRRLERERSTKFADWKLLTLDLLERYLLARENETRSDEVRTFGTTSFYDLWEKACKVAFGDALKTKLGNLRLQIASKYESDKEKTLLEIIPRPQWERWQDDGYVECGDVDTLIPDTVALEDGLHDKRLFCIYDAKYYVPSLSGKMKHQPGLESVTKQFLYQSAYREFIEAHRFDATVNVFLVPSANDEPINLARVTFDKVMGEEKKPFNNYVNMWSIPARKIFEAYLANARVGDSIVETIIEGNSYEASCSKS